jgi:hypothetical protein
MIRDSLLQCSTPDADGLPSLTVTLPDAAALQRLAETLGRLMEAGAAAGDGPGAARANGGVRSASAGMSA